MLNGLMVAKKLVGEGGSVEDIMKRIEREIEGEMLAIAMDIANREEMDSLGVYEDVMAGMV